MREDSEETCSFEVARQVVAAQVALGISAQVTDLRLQWMVR